MHIDFPPFLEDEYGGWLSRQIVYDSQLPPPLTSLTSRALGTLIEVENVRCISNEVHQLCGNAGKDFTAYADVLRELGDRVLHWTTLNEANVFTISGYDIGETPPQRCSSPFGVGNCSKDDFSTEPYVAGHHILLAHASAAKLYRKQVLHPSLFKCLAS
ncbi:hypothetical protein RHGRI_013691 [Rhododendron griersonianum]|uniref:Beta-glucosidase n=1 Tax=Rhododendron griersonianum TaxID=479676 RepID=A0AAV6K6P3_9ERIC|nr:hypothetical protein RHGRI_013691 [Rhododendron griersonianum]